MLYVQHIGKNLAQHTPPTARFLHKELRLKVHKQVQILPSLLEVETGPCFEVSGTDLQKAQDFQSFLTWW